MSKYLSPVWCFAALAVFMLSSCASNIASGPTRSPAATLTAAPASPTAFPAVTSTPPPATSIPAAATPIPSTSACVSIDGLPDRSCTPGAIDSRVTQDNIYQTICVSGYTQTVRPSTSYTTPLKVRQMAAYGWTGTTADYEEDHLIPLEIGGNPTDPNNLWPEPYAEPNGARDKDKVENSLHDKVCSGQMTLAQAQSLIATNWEAESAGGTSGEIVPAPPPPAAVNTPTQGCCKYCATGKACGDGCISKNYTCHQPPGCACNAN
jgi:hypothetical protein